MPPKSNKAPDFIAAEPDFIPADMAAEKPSQQEMDAAFVQRMKALPKSNKPAPAWGGYQQTFGAEDLIWHAPLIGGMVGSAIGSLGGPAGAVVGATYGGYAGTGIKRDFENQPRSTKAELIGGGIQGLYELGGQVGARVLGRLAKPVLEKYPDFARVLGVTDKPASKTVGHLTAAASEKGFAGPTKEAIAATVGDIESEMAKLPPQERTVDGFLNAVTKKRSALHEEYGNAIGPHAREEVDTTNIVKALADLRKEWMMVAIKELPGGATQHEGEAELQAIKDAMLKFKRPRTIGQLDSLRQQLNTDLGAFYNKVPNARYAAENGNINLAIDAAVASAARDTLYPIADRVAGKPAGYFADVLDREGNLIKLRGILQKRVTDLSAAQAISEVTPRLSSENISLSAHAGSAPRAGVYGIRQVLYPPRELSEASKHVAKAFPGMRINSLPYGILFSNTLRAEHPLTPRPKTGPLSQSPLP